MPKSSQKENIEIESVEELLRQLLAEQFLSILDEKFKIKMGGAPKMGAPKPPSYKSAAPKSSLPKSSSPKMAKKVSSWDSFKSSISKANDRQKMNDRIQGLQSDLTGKNKTGVFKSADSEKEESSDEVKLKEQAANAEEAKDQLASIGRDFIVNQARTSGKQPADEILKAFEGGAEDLKKKLETDPTAVQSLLDAGLTEMLTTDKAAAKKLASQPSVGSVTPQLVTKALKDSREEVQDAWDALLGSMIEGALADKESLAKAVKEALEEHESEEKSDDDKTNDNKQKKESINMKTNRLDGRRLRGRALTESQARKLIREALPLAALLPVIKKIAVVAGPRLAAALVKTAPKLAQGGKQAVAFAKKHPKVVDHLVNNGLRIALKKASDNPELMKHAGTLGLVDDAGNLKQIDSKTIRSSLDSAEGVKEQSWGEVLKQLGAAIGENEGELLKTAKESGKPSNESMSISRGGRVRLDEAGLRRLVRAALRGAEGIGDGY